VADRAKGYAMPGVRVDGNDPLAVMAVLTEALGRARSGGGPTLVECVTFRFRGHYFGDPMAYIPKEQLAAAEEADPLPRFRARLVAAGTCTGEELDNMDTAAEAAVEEALATVTASPEPPLDELDRDVYANTHNVPA
jgi:pyruvate dehydrogenase E1 component alpha subunit